MKMQCFAMVRRGWGGTEGRARKAESEHHRRFDKRSFSFAFARCFWWLFLAFLKSHVKYLRIIDLRARGFFHRGGGLKATRTSRRSWRVLAAEVPPRQSIGIKRLAMSW